MHTVIGAAIKNINKLKTKNVSGAFENTMSLNFIKTCFNGHAFNGILKENKHLNMLVGLSLLFENGN